MLRVSSQSLAEMKKIDSEGKNVFIICYSMNLSTLI